MLYLIGGAPGAGKSYFAHRLATEQGAQVLSLDDQMPEFNKNIPRAEFAKRLPVWQAKFEKRLPHYADYATEAETYWPFIEPTLQAKLQSTTNTIIEGAQLSPPILRAWLDDLLPEQRERVKAIFMTDPSAPFNEAFRDDAIKFGFQPQSRHTSPDED